MEKLKQLSEIAFKVVAFFSGITGAMLVIILLSNADAFVVGLSVGESLDVRLSNIELSHTKIWGFGIGYIIVLALDMSIVVTRFAVKVNYLQYEGEARTFARNQNRSLNKLGDRLCTLSVLISLMSVGVFMFAGMNLKQFLALVETPIFYVQLVLFMAVALGVPASISRLSTYISVKYAVIITKLIVKIEDSISRDIDNSLNFKKEKKGNKTIEELLNL